VEGVFQATGSSPRSTRRSHGDTDAALTPHFILTRNLIFIRVLAESKQAIFNYLK